MLILRHNRLLRTIYFDMDGVLVNFVGRMEELTGKSIQVLNSQPTDEIGQIIQTRTDKGLFLDLDPMEDFNKMKDLMDWFNRCGVDVMVLTHVGKHQPHKVIQQKEQWLREHRVRYPLYYTMSSKDKAYFADEFSMLIDDRTKCTEVFRAQGGMAIKHQTYKDTKLELDKWGIYVS